MNDTQLQAWFDQSDAKMVADVRRYGVHLVYVGGGECSNPACCGGSDDGPDFGYTVGLFGLGHPELLIVGAGMDTAAGVLNELSERVRQGENLLPGQLLTFAEWPHRVVVETVPNPGEILYQANHFYDRPAEASVPAYQLSYDDKAGRFPWEEGYAAPDRQPRPGAFRA
jgi:hypothetical protein